MTAGDTLALVASSLLVVASGVVVAAETAVTGVGRVRALAWADEGRRGASRLSRLLEHPERALATAALARMASRVSASTMVGIVGWRQGGVGGAVLAVALLLAFVLGVGELLPRRVAERWRERVACRAAGPMATLARIAPLAAVGSVVSSGRTATRPRNGTNGVADEGDQAEDGEDVDREEEQLIHSIFEFGDTVVREVMAPRTDMVSVPVGTTVDGALDVAIPAGFSRLPVHGDNLDDIVGVVFVKDLIRAARSGEGSQPVTRVLRKVVFVPEQKRVAELLREMQTRKFHLAIAVDEYGGTAGLVTLEDLLEEIVGEIIDEYDVEEPRVEELGDGVLRVAGRTPIDEINEHLGVELPSAEWDTVGGLIFDLVGHVPAEGEWVSFQGIDFEAERVQGRRIISVKVRLAGSSARPAADTGT